MFLTAAVRPHPRPYICRSTRSAYLFRSVDDEVAAGVERTLVELGQIAVGESRQQAVCGAQHDRDLTCGGRGSSDRPAVHGAQTAGTVS